MPLITRAFTALKFGWWIRHYDRSPGSCGATQLLMMTWMWVTFCCVFYIIASLFYVDYSLLHSVTHTSRVGISVCCACACSTAAVGHTEHTRIHVTLDTGRNCATEISKYCRLYFSESLVVHVPVDSTWFCSKKMVTTVIWWVFYVKKQRTCYTHRLPQIVRCWLSRLQQCFTQRTKSKNAIWIKSPQEKSERIN